MNEFAVFQEGIPPRFDLLESWMLALEDGLKVFNSIVEMVDKRLMKEIDEVNKQVNCRG